jgi:hypothetical protein
LGALTGGALGGLVGPFVGLGMPTEHARVYEAAVRAGGVAVKVPNHVAANCARRILTAQGARQVEDYTRAL